MRPVIGVVVGNVFDLLISNVLGFIILILLAYNFFCCEVSEGDARERIETLSTSSQFLVLSFFGGALVSLFSGYLAAWIANRAERLCGLLSSINCLILSVYGLLAGLHVPLWMEIGSIFVGPALGLLGGQLRRVATDRRLVSP